MTIFLLCMLPVAAMIGFFTCAMLTAGTNGRQEEHRQSPACDHSPEESA